MKHIENELIVLREDIIEMAEFVAGQVNKSREAIDNGDLNLAREIVENEKRTNAFELKIDNTCESILALYNPVANDLRLVLAILITNNNLERIGDLCKGVSKFMLEHGKPFDKYLLEKNKILLMYDTIISMFEDVLNGMVNEDTKTARQVFLKDDTLDEINKASTKNSTEIIKTNPENTLQQLYMLSIIRKLERMGDQIKNIAEELIFYIEAKVVKHRKKNGKKEG